MAGESERNVQIAFRVAPEVRQQLVELADILGQQLGAKVTLTQAVEVAIREAMQRRKEV